jgi:hypothetical protein
MKTDSKGYKQNIKEIIAYAESIKGYLEEYEEKEEALSGLTDVISPADSRAIRTDLQKRYAELSLESIGYMLEQVAELKYRFEVYV